MAAYDFDAGAGSVATDDSGNGNDGTIVGATWTTGQVGDALSFDAPGSYVSVPDGPLLELTAAVTLEAWIYPTKLGPGYWMIVGKTTVGTPNNYYLAVHHSELDFGFVVDGAWYHHTTEGAAIQTDTWTHVAAVFSNWSHTVRLYVDGTLLLKDAEPETPVVNGEGLYIGASFPAGAFTGSIDSVRVYARPLSGVEIQGDMDAGLPALAAANALAGSVACDPGSSDQRLDVSSLVLRGGGSRSRMAAHATFAEPVPFDPTATGATLDLAGADGTLLYEAALAGSAFDTNRRRSVFRLRREQAGLQRLVMRRRAGRVTLTLTSSGAGLDGAGEDTPLTITLRLGTGCPLTLRVDCARNRAATRCRGVRGSRTP